MAYEITGIDEETIKNELHNVLESMNLWDKNIDMQIFTKAVTSLINHMRFKVVFNANVTICASSQDISNRYGEVLAHTIEKWFPDCCAVTGEKFIHERKSWKEHYKALKVLLIKDCSARNLDKLYATLSEFENDGWNPAIILCVDDETFERIQKFDYNDYRLFYYLCGYKIVIPDINEDHIREIVCDELEKNGYVTSDAFKKLLKVYIDAVYPEACLTINEFVKDTTDRVIQIHYRRIDPQNILDEKDVPYSIKVDRILEKLN